MKVARLDANDDWTLGRGESDYLRDQDAIRQSVRTRLRSFQNDWFLDTGAGIDWITLCGRRGGQDLLVNEIRRVILGTDGVLAITALEVVPDRVRRTMQVRATLTTIFSAGVTEGVAVTL